MPTEKKLHDTVKRLLSSETFEVDELPAVLAKRGYAEADVSAAIKQVVAQLDDEKQSPAFQGGLARRRRSVRLIRVGLLTLIVGYPWLWYAGLLGVLNALLLIAIAGAFMAAGYRGLRS